MSMISDDSNFTNISETIFVILLKHIILFYVYVLQQYYVIVL